MSCPLPVGAVGPGCLGAGCVSDCPAARLSNRPPSVVCAARSAIATSCRTGSPSAKRGGVTAGPDVPCNGNCRPANSKTAAALCPIGRSSPEWASAITMSWRIGVPSAVRGGVAAGPEVPCRAIRRPPNSKNPARGSESFASFTSTSVGRCADCARRISMFSDVVNSPPQVDVRPTNLSRRRSHDRPLRGGNCRAMT
jgi:hypothetical protein